MIPFLEQGLMYNEAKEKAGYSDNTSDKSFLPIISNEEITNPVVFRAITQTRKLVKAIILKYGKPTYIHIELAREMSKSREERNKIASDMKERAENNERIRNILINEFKIQNPKPKDFIKYNLWIEQKHECIYSQQKISAEELFNDNYVEVDHIIPLSVSMDDSYENKVLVKSSENQKKGRRTPLEYMGSEEKQNKFRNHINSLNLSNKKKERLLLEKLSDYEKTDFSNRALGDTRYITSFVKNYLENHVQFADKQIKVPVRVYNGLFTKFIRYRFGIPKNREFSNRHHALDATIIASFTTPVRLKVEKYYQQKEEHRIDPRKVYIPTPWIHYNLDIENRTYNDNVIKFYEENKELKELYKDLIENNVIRPVFVSRMPRRKVTGPAHNETIASGKEFSKGKIIKRVHVSSLNAKNIEKLVTNDIVLKSQLLEVIKNNPKSLADGFEYIRPGKQKITIKRIKIYEDSRSGLPVRGGIAGNGTMARIDIFKDDKKYYVVPVYSFQISSKRIPNKAIVRGKMEKDWIDVSEKDFVFSVYPGELLNIIDLNNNEIEGYYVKTDRGSATFDIVAHDSPKKADNKEKEGPKNYWTIAYSQAKSIKKYYVDYLGNKYPIKNAKRVL